MAINDVAGERKGVSCMRYICILRKFIGRNFVSGLHTLKPKNPEKLITYKLKKTLKL